MENETTEKNSLARLKDNPYLVLSSRLVIGGIFLLSGIAKIPQMEVFVDSVRAYQILPYALTLPFAYLMPVLEIVLAIALILGIKVRLASLGSALLLTMFTVAIVINLLRGNVLENCGCFGIFGPEPLSWKKVTENIALILIATIPTWSRVEHIFYWGSKLDKKNREGYNGN